MNFLARLPLANAERQSESTLIFVFDSIEEESARLDWRLFEDVVSVSAIG